MPSPTPAWNSLRTVQRLTIKNTLASQQHVLTVLYPTTNDTVFDCTVSAAAGANASLLQHPRLGLNVTVNGVLLPELIPLAGGQSAADRMSSLLQQVLSLSSTDVGVELLAQPQPGDTVVFRVAVPQAKVWAGWARVWA